MNTIFKPHVLDVLLESKVFQIKALQEAMYVYQTAGSVLEADRATPARA